MSQNIGAVLKKHWGYDSFLPLQEEAMECVLAGRDSIVVLPTGGGKSLCFQAPAVAMSGLGVVVSPLISLMKDQVDALTECGVPAARIDSTQSPEERASVLTRLRQGELRLLYLAPERIATPKSLEFLRALRVAFVAVDEAHCVSMWGHDFRPEYRQLGILKGVFPNLGIHSYTATATPQVRQDIAQYLRLNEPEVMVGSFDRPNLVYKVTRRTNALTQVCEVLDRHRGESGIIYRIRRNDVDRMCAQLRERGYRVAPYHAGMEAEDRKRSQNAFAKEEVDTVVATVAFGMGIDKSNVRYVIHAGMPKSIEHYQQESGRAGRDGLEAECCLLYSDGDYGVWSRILSDLEGEAKEIAAGKLNRIYDYCKGMECRHRALVRYFDQDLDRENCAACDVCLGNMEYMDNCIPTVRTILAAVAEIKQRFGADYVASVLTGSRDQRIAENGHDKLRSYGILTEFTKRAVRDWIEQLVTQGFLVKSAEYSVLTISEAGREISESEIAPRLLKPAQRPLRSAKVVEDSWDGVERGLFETLRALRREIADKQNVPAFVVFSDATLRDMARKRPSTRDGFLDVRGVGERKREQYGASFVTAICGYCRAHSVAMDVR